ncbi:MAG: UDP-3-O-acyl-N-acetylglucosamine deacetylase [Rickettsiaceae bacterium]|nr:UDP-3-O-acyl-N-acetylglucosamine deacetylase [Rickettsiaceae bacterium]
MQQQTTIKYPAICYGIGVHSGKQVQVTLKPAKANEGVVFVRTDISADNYIKASYENVVETSYCTKISNQNLSVSTIEHLMAAIWGAGIDNLVVEVDGPEVPIMDGSSKPFVFLLECAQKQFLRERKASIKILKEVVAETCHGGYNIVYPSEEFNISLDIDFQSNAIGKQTVNYSKRELFNSEVAPARTFGFVHEIEHLHKAGLALGASLDNAIGIDRDVILNHDGLRFKDEFARHKLLDALGDFALGGPNIIGEFKCYKPSHSLNNLLLHKIFANPNNYMII